MNPTRRDNIRDIKARMAVIAAPDRKELQFVASARLFAIDFKQFSGGMIAAW
ncbi:MAG: hypothetical protein WD767_20175 [Alphaproteobacteria bacterium]